MPGQLGSEGDSDKKGEERQQLHDSAHGLLEAYKASHEFPRPVRGQNSLRPAAGFCRLSLGTIRIGG
jgi:hypothetical protein